MKASFFPLIFIFCLTFDGNTLQAQALKNEEVNYNTLFQNLKWRCIGPFRGGRSNAVSGVKGDMTTYYMGTTGGGLWKTEDIGLSWKNISDGYFTTGSVGAIAVSSSDPNVIYAGLGEHAVRGVMTHHGDGVYKSSDAGKTWKKSGLEKAQHISRIVIHPLNPDIAWVAVQGALYGPSEDRGIYKTTDGGITWKKTLYVDQHTGCSELSMDADNHRILYAATWEHGRKPWKIISGGPGSGLWKSTDGGENWFKIHHGLPKELGKMSIAVAPSNPQKVYALVESDSEKDQGGLFVSDNAGESWSKINGDNRLVQRAWYYIELFVDPKNDKVIYVLSAPALRSEDGGKTWVEIDGPHGDYHDLWINPDNPKNMIIADDGGASVSVNYGKTWSPQNHLPTAQLYRLNADNLFPYNIYAGQQDNTSLKIASAQPWAGGIDHNGMSFSAGGESAFLAFDPDNPRYVMGGSYLGTIEYFNSEVKAGTKVMASPFQYLALEPKKMKYRYNWNAPIIWSRHEKNSFYHAAQVLLRTRDGGKTWDEVSPDLTRNDITKQGKGGGPYTNEIVGAENYGTISYVTESRHEKGTLWVGSDDGLVHVTRDGGKTWKNVTPPDLAECLINAIEVSPHDPATVYLATTRYKFNDHTPGLYKTTDYGKTWQAINQGIAKNAFTRVVREDPGRAGLLYAGTETGLYLSWNGGKQWQAFSLNLPVTPITDLLVHQGNLIASTSGRSIWILDDIRVLHQYEQDKTDAYLMTPTPAFLVNGRSEMDGDIKHFKGTNPSRGVNPATGMVLYYFLPDTLRENLTLDIYDDKNVLIRKFSSRSDSLFVSYDGGPPAEPVLSRDKGLNRFVWDLRHHTVPGVPGVYIEANYRGHKTIPGQYILVLSDGTWRKEVKAPVKANPGYPTTLEEYVFYDRMMTDMENKVTDMHRTINDLYNKQKQLSQILPTLPGDPTYNNLKSQAALLLNKMKAWDEKMVQRKSQAYDDVENFENKFSAEYMFLMNHVESEIPSVNKPSEDRKAALDELWQQYKQEAENILQREIPDLNQQFWKMGIGAVWK